MTPRYWDWSPVRTQAELTLAERGIVGRQGNVTAGLIADLLGTDRKSIGAHDRGGRLRDANAERYALALGVEPVQLWPDWYDAVGVGLVDARMIADTYGYTFGHVAKLARKPGFPQQVTGKRKAAEWEGHPNTRTWDAAIVDRWMSETGRVVDYADLDRPISTREIAMRFGLQSRDTVAKWARQPGFPASAVRSKRHPRWKPSEVDAWVEATRPGSSNKFATSAPKERKAA